MSSFLPPPSASPALLELKMSKGLTVILGIFVLGSLGLAAASVLSFLAAPDVGSVVFGVASALLAGGFAVLAAITLRRRLTLYEWGVSVTGLLGEVQVPWAEIVEVRAPAALGAGANLMAGTSFRTARGKRFGLFGYGTSGPKAGEAIVNRVVPRLAEEITGRLKAGGSQAFGKLRADWNGVEHKGSRVGWGEIERANFSPEGFRIFPKDRPEATIILPLATPNLHVFFAVWKRRLAEGGTEAGAASAAPPGTGAPSLEHVHGFADADPELGKIVCGKGRRGWLEGLWLGLGGLSLVGMAVPFFWPPGLIIFGIAAAICALAWWAARSATFAVYEKGLKKARKSLRWEETADLTYAVTDQYHNGAYVGRMIGLTLAGKSGAGKTSSIRVGGRGAKMEGLCTSVLDRVLPVLLVRRAQEIEAGGDLKVDKLALRARTLAWKQEEVGYGDLHSWEVRKGFLHIWKKGQEKSWAIVPINGKNARLVLPLLEHLFARSRQGAARA